MNLLAVFIDNVTPEVLRVWQEAAPYAAADHHGYVLVENLARLASRYPEQVAAVFKSALEKFLPDYDPEHVKRCVKDLADAGRIEDAELICNLYVEKWESLLLKETYQALREQRRRSLAAGDAAAKRQ